LRAVEILEKIKEARGANEKKSILENHNDNTLLLQILRAGLDPFIPFHVVKVPKVIERNEETDELTVWNLFFKAVDACATRTVTGKEAITVLHRVFQVAPEKDEVWMRKVLKKHLAIGASIKTVNKVFPGLITTFDVSLAQKFEEKRIEEKVSVYIEPKLDGIRCFAIVENNTATLYARSGKIISNFSATIGKELSLLPDGCYDGEIMGEDFISLMRQAYRKEDIETEGTYLALFDYLPLEDWKTKETNMSSRSRYGKLYTHLFHAGTLKYIRHVERRTVKADYSEIIKIHDEYVSLGYEGAMIKDINAPYKFGRGYEVMKLKAFHDVDLKIKELLEGTGKHVDKLGSVVVEFKGVNVQVGSGFSDELRESVWNSPKDFIGRMIEVRYQEVTPDGSLRFPTFVCFRNDR
jgi:DNA ligase-1